MSDRDNEIKRLQTQIQNLEEITSSYKDMGGGNEIKRLQTQIQNLEEITSSYKDRNKDMSSRVDRNKDMSSRVSKITDDIRQLEKIIIKHDDNLLKKQTTRDDKTKGIRDDKTKGIRDDIKHLEKIVNEHDKKQTTKNQPSSSKLTNDNLGDFVKDMNKQLESLGKKLEITETLVDKTIENNEKCTSCLYTRGPKGGAYRKTSGGNKIYLPKKRRPLQKCLLKEKNK